MAYYNVCPNCGSNLDPKSGNQNEYGKKKNDK